VAPAADSAAGALLAAEDRCCPRPSPANMPPETAAEVAAAGAAGAAAELAGVPNAGVPNAAPGGVDQLKAPPVEAAVAVAEALLLLLLPKAGGVELPKAGADAGVPKAGADAPNAGAAVPKTGAADGAPNVGAEAAPAPKAGADAAGAPNAAPKPLEVPKPPNSDEPADGADAAAALPNPAEADANPAAGDDTPNGAGAGLLGVAPAAAAVLAAPVDRMMQRTCSGCRAASHHMKLGSSWLPMHPGNTITLLASFLSVSPMAVGLCTAGHSRSGSIDQAQAAYLKVLRWPPHPLPPPHCCPSPRQACLQGTMPPPHPPALHHLGHLMAGPQQPQQQPADQLNWQTWMADAAAAAAAAAGAAGRAAVHLPLGLSQWQAQEHQYGLLQHAA